MVFQCINIQSLEILPTFFKGVTADKGQYFSIKGGKGACLNSTLNLFPDYKGGEERLSEKYSDKGDLSKA